MSSVHVPVMHRIVRGEIECENSVIDDEVSRWHDTIVHPSWTLHGWLGMMWSEYGRWIKDPNQLWLIVAERTAEQESDLSSLSDLPSSGCATPISWGERRNPNDDDHMHVLVDGCRVRVDDWKFHCGMYHAFVRDGVDSGPYISRCGNHSDPEPGWTKIPGAQGCEVCFETTNSKFHAPRRGLRKDSSPPCITCPKI